MKKFLIPFLILFIQCSSNGTQLSQSERDFAVEEINKSKNNLLATVNGLSDEQLNFKIDETTWSIAECVEHITLFVDQVFEILEESLELPANPERRKDVKFTDKELMVFVKDRTKKNKTDEDLEPQKRYGDYSSTLTIYNEKTQAHIDYIIDTKDDLRNHYVNLGTVDTYQLFLYMAAHTERHIAQINEIKSNVNFPKN